MKKIREIDSVLHVNEMVEESLSPELLGKWSDVVVELSKNRNLAMPKQGEKNG